MSKTEEMIHQAETVALICKLFEQRVDEHARSYAPTAKLVEALDKCQQAGLSMGSAIEDYASKGRDE